MKDNFSTTPYMSSNLREYNRIYKEVNDIYRDAASKFGLFFLQISAVSF